jgi:hypothetical protein
VQLFALATSPNKFIGRAADTARNGRLSVIYLIDRLTAADRDNRSRVNLKGLAGMDLAHIDALRGHTDQPVGRYPPVEGDGVADHQALSGEAGVFQTESAFGGTVQGRLPNRLSARNLRWPTW